MKTIYKDYAWWTTSNYALAEGQIGFDTTNNITKIGNGVDVWDDLPQVGGGGGGISDGDKGDITVSGSGANWTIDNLAVTNAKINDVSATKVTEDSTHRFVTDTEKSTWNAKQNALSNASSSVSGILTSTDWNTFNNKQNTLTVGTLDERGSTVLTITGGTNSVIGSGTSIEVKQSNTSQSGFLSSTDWNTFNNKLSSISRVSAYTISETSISAATYADITGASISLTAGTWIIFATVNGRAVNAAFVMFCAITDGANTVISEAAQNSPASGTANSNNWTSVSMTTIVSPASTTTYKLRAARGNSAPTTTWTASDGIGTNTTNNGTNASDKSTGIFAIKLA